MNGRCSPGENVAIAQGSFHQTTSDDCRRVCLDVKRSTRMAWCIRRYACIPALSVENPYVLSQVCLCKGSGNCHCIGTRSFDWGVLAKKQAGHTLRVDYQATMQTRYTKTPLYMCVSCSVSNLLSWYRSSIFAVMELTARPAFEHGGTRNRWDDVSNAFHETHGGRECIVCITARLHILYRRTMLRGTASSSQRVFLKVR